MKRKNTKDKSSRMALGDITNKKQKIGNEKNRVVLRDITNEDQGNDVIKDESSKITNAGAKRRRIELATNKASSWQVKTGGAGTTNRLSIPIDLSSDEEEEDLSEAAKRKSTLYSLTAEDLASISTKENMLGAHASRRSSRYCT